MADADEYVLDLEWDFFARATDFRVLEHGYLLPEIQAVTVLRDDLSLKVEASGPEARLRPGEPPLVAGTLLSAIPPVKVQAPCGALGELRRVVPTQTSMSSVSFAASGKPGIRQRASAYEVDITFKDAPVVHLTEWLANVSNDYLWLGGTERQYVERYRRIRSPDDDTPPATVETAPITRTRYSRDHTRFVASIEPPTTVFFGVVPKEFAPERLRPGFLSYSAATGIPDESRRKEIREALSFITGRQLAYLGYSAYDSDWNLVRAMARRGYIAGGMNSLRRGAIPPAPLSEKPDAPWLEPDLLARLVQQFLSCGQELGLGYILWLVWHAHASPVETQAAQFGAALESLRRRFLKSRAPIKTKLLPPAEWTHVLAALREALDTATAAVDEKRAADIKILRHQLDNLNRRPATGQTEEFFGVLTLPVGDRERRALQERNRPAHGGMYSEEEYPQVIGHVRALYTLFHRALLKILGGARYIDYASPEHPTRRIDEPVADTPDASGERGEAPLA